nr:hypothetical protein Iba_chr09bCG8220 [Ipomoea batatas]
MRRFLPRQVNQMRHLGRNHGRHKLPLFNRINLEKLQQERGVHRHHPRQCLRPKTQLSVVGKPNPGLHFHQLLCHAVQLYGSQLPLENLGRIKLVPLHFMELRVGIMKLESSAVSTITVMNSVVRARTNGLWRCRLRRRRVPQATVGVMSRQMMGDKDGLPFPETRLEQNDRGEEIPGIPEKKRIKFGLREKVGINSPLSSQQ